MKNTGKIQISNWQKGALQVHLTEHQSPPQIPLRFEPYIYLTSKHLLTQTANQIYCFSLFRNNENEAAAIFHCVHDTRQNWISPARAPFGGIQCDELCSIDEISFLLDCIELWILQCGGNQIIIKTAPSCYDLNINKLLSECYNLHHYKIEKHVNHSIPVTSLIYANLINQSENRRLKKCRSAGFIADVYENPIPETVYDFLSSCRLEKGYDLSLNLSQLKELLHKFPNEVTVFTVKNQEMIIALTVTIRVNQSILYHFLSSSLSSYAQYSPAVMLTEVVYIFCQNKKITILDLGISLDHNGIEKASLIRFKENIGGIKNYKATYTKFLC